MIAFGWLDGVMTDRFHRAVDRELAARQTTPTDLPEAVASGDTTGPAWRPFSASSLSRHIEQGKTVFVEFTADWCLTCKANEAVAIRRPEVRELIDDLGIVALKADKTGPAPEADRLLGQLGNRAGSIPFYAIFPAGDPSKPIVLDGVFTSPERILDALRRAGPSRTGSEPGASELSESGKRGEPFSRNTASSGNVETELQRVAAVATPRSV
jgi:thiol-disulfide isomerase/thioredoxin